MRSRRQPAGKFGGIRRERRAVPRVAVTVSWLDLDAIEEEGRRAQGAGNPRSLNPFDAISSPSAVRPDQGEYRFAQWRRALAWWRGWDNPAAKPGGH
jgi:hypothetical protein